MQNKVTLKELIEECNLDIISEEIDLETLITDDEITSPGLELAGLYDYYEPKRLILVGSKEISFLNLLDEKVVKERLVKLLSLNPPAIIASRNVNLPKVFTEVAKTYHVPILHSDLRTTQLSSKLFSFLRERLALRVSIHGVLLDINGMGTLIIGKSGIGKSETALELVKRGHQLVADDRVDIYEREVGLLIGSAPKTIQQYIEVRGVGIVNIVDMFGVGSYRENKKIRLVIELEQWDKNKVYDRLGLETVYETYFHTDLPKIVIPILPGRNTAVLVESAAMNQKLKFLGSNGARKLTEEIGKITRGENK